MIRLIARLLAGAEIVALVFALRHGFIAATESVGRRKGRARFMATALFGVCLCLPAAVLIFHNASLPSFEFEGTIQSARVIHSSSRHYSAYLLIHTTARGSVTLHASDRSGFFRPREHVKAQYQADTGELLKAEFFDTNSHTEGKFNGTTTFGPYWLLVSGAFVIFAAFNIRRRDPEGAQELARESSTQSDAVDEDSLLRLSEPTTEKHR